MSTTAEGDRRGAAGDLLVTNAGQLLTLAGLLHPRRGPEHRDLGLVEDGAVLVEDGRIVAAGPRQHVEREARSVEVLDAGGRVVMPGFVDPHTHAVFAGSREGELAAKLAGKSYAEIAAAGGGILETVRATRRADKAQLRAETADRLRRMLAHGTTTVEVKSGYGLDLKNEVKVLEVARSLGRALPLQVIRTFLGAHAVPPEFAEEADGYVDLLVRQVVPEVAARRLARYCDVFVDAGFFTADQGRRVLQAGQDHGLPSKVHADELTSSGGTELAAELQAVSADHLLHPSEAGLRALAAAGTVAVALPGTSFASQDLPFVDARRLLDAGLPVALGTDLSPNSWVESMPFVVSLACYRLGMRPEEALAAATINAAWAVGEAAAVGSLEEGKRGDLLVLRARRYEEIPYRVAANPVDVVVKDGAVVARDGRLTPEGGRG